MHKRWGASCVDSDLERQSGVRALFHRRFLGDEGEKTFAVRLSDNFERFINVSIDVGELSCLFWNDDEEVWDGNGCVVRSRGCRARR